MLYEGENKAVAVTTSGAAAAGQLNWLDKADSPCFAGLSFSGEFVLNLLPWAAQPEQRVRAVPILAGRASVSEKVMKAFPLMPGAPLGACMCERPLTSCHSCI